MVRYLIWIEGDEDGWACSNCRWRFPVPTFLSEKEGKAAYNRLAAVKFDEHTCEGVASRSATKPKTNQSVGTTLAERARMLIKRGYTPKVAVELVLHDTEIECRNDSRIMEKARSEGEDFLRRVRQGLI
jgi:hypothetical protein